MLKIYPSPFNKFAFFILYGLLSVAVITLAQTTPSPSFPVPAAPTIQNGGSGSGGSGGNGNGGNDGNSGKCKLSVPQSQQTIIGYVQTKTINPATIQWDNYDFINVIADLNAVRSPAADLTVLDTIVTARKSPTKVLLSLRDYDYSTLPNDLLGYQDLINATINTINEHKLDGVDIQYPGMIGRYCNNNPWDAGRDPFFSQFIRDLHDKTKPLNKTLMFTVGNDTIPSLEINNVDILNIEIYHYSFYDNYNNPEDRVKIGPNAPFNAFRVAYDKWNSTGISKDKIIMGVDLGNTLQLVDNRNITNDQTITANTVQIRADGEYSNSTRIIFCQNNNDALMLYSFPWYRLFDENILSLNDNDDCSGIKVADDWQQRRDESPWLSKQVPDAGNLWYYISYEDFTSLSNKLNFVISSAGGISISDISYDTSGDSSLINYMQSINGKQDKTTNSGPGGSPSPGSNTTSPSDPDTSTNAPPGNRTGKIVGAVLGSIFGLVILSGIFFVGYKHKEKIPFLQNKFGNEKFHGTSYMNQPGMIPEGSPRMIIPETTAVPVAPSFVTAMFDFAGKEENDLSFKKGDKIEVLERGDGPNDWWVGRVNGAVGEFPGNYVKE